MFFRNGVAAWIFEPVPVEQLAIVPGIENTGKYKKQAPADQRCMAALRFSRA